MSLPTRNEAHGILNQYVSDEYQLLHAEMVATAMEGYAEMFGKDVDLWYITGLLHDIDFQKHPDEHPGPSLEWFRRWSYPEELIHAVEAHAYGYNGFATEPETKLAAALLACDEITGIFYAYQKLNPVPFSEMKQKSIRKRFKEKDFAKGVDRSVVEFGCERLGISIDEHIGNLIGFFKKLD